MRATIVLPAVAALVFLLSGTPPSHAESWREHSVWDDGRAEFAAYQVTWPRYGASHPGEALMVVVKEPWAPDLDVKADQGRSDGFDVLKLNHLRHVPTGIYAYHQMASAFVRRDDGQLVKLATSSFEACGLTTGEMVGGELETSSYFDGQGRRSQPWDPAAVADDALPMVLRDFATGEVPDQLLVFPSLLTARLPVLEPRVFRLARSAVGPVVTPAGTFEVVLLRLEAEGTWLEYFFEAATPHRLVRSERSDGTRYELTKVDRLPYWELNQPGDESWWPQR